MQNIFNYIQLISMLSLFEPQGVMSKTISNSSNTNLYPVPRVVNGRRATLGQFPYQVGLKKKSRPPNIVYYTFCGGSLIGENKILTAAHCMEELNTRSLVLCPCFGSTLKENYAVAATLLNFERFGENSEAQWREISTTHIHKDFNFPLNDIAVVFTNKPFVFGQYVSSLPFASDYIDYGDRKCTVSGYGKTSNTHNADSLMWAQLDLVSSDFCNLNHEINMPDFICTSSELTDVLEGDSGGPLVCFNSSDPQEGEKGVIVGVVSGAHIIYGTFFTRVSSYKHFIATSVQMSKSTNFKPGMTCYFALILFNFKFVLF